MSSFVGYQYENVNGNKIKSENLGVFLISEEGIILFT